mmetsp:Transcript_9290/g.24564  ORF Transcript_9290/g.24564 Transcript_9290/m.24564 type:complete len:279 (+) Transcript_9290:358-1194(+)
MREQQQQRCKFARRNAFWERQQQCGLRTENGMDIAAGTRAGVRVKARVEWSRGEDSRVRSSINTAAAAEVCCGERREEHTDKQKTKQSNKKHYSGQTIRTQTKTCTMATKPLSSLERVSIKNLLVAEPAALTIDINIEIEIESIASKERSNTRTSQVLMPSRPKNPADRWLAEEDDLLRAWVARHGARRWGELSRLEFQSRRTPTQLRARYTDVLDSKRSLASWSAAEDAAVWALHGELGNRWAEIARRLDSGRVSNDVKNRYRLLVRKAARPTNCYE